jgi:hypothetical protein
VAGIVCLVPSQQQKQNAHRAISAQKEAIILHLAHRAIFAATTSFQAFKEIAMLAIGVEMVH